MPGLGRIYAPDRRDFKLREHPLMSAVVTRGSKIWPMFSKVLDQGNTGTCVGFGWKHLLMAAPITHKAAMPPSAFDIYDWSTQNDPWLENDHDTLREMGTSVRAGAKAVQFFGLLSEYRFTTVVDEAADWIGGRDVLGKFIGGSVVIGVDFYSSMFNLTKDGYMRIEPNASLVGGHCMLLIGWDQKCGRFRGVNSWSSAWGQNGRFWLDGETAARLFREDGEVACATERRATT